MTTTAAHPAAAHPATAHPAPAHPAPARPAPAVTPVHVRPSLLLPGPAVAVGRPPRAEVAALVAVVPLLAVPVLLATMAAVWAVTVAIALTAVVAWASLARRVVVGHGWVADRRLLRYRVTPAAHLRAAELVHNGHGGVVRLHRLSGRPHRLRRVELDAPGTRRALSELLAASPAADRSVALALAAGAHA